MLKRAGGQAARARCKTPRGVGAAIDRITHGEGAIAELKRHGAGRARCRGTAKLQIQLLLAATAINLKRLTTRLPAAENGCAGDNTAARAHLAILNACLRALAADPGRDFYDRLLAARGGAAGGRSRRDRFRAEHRCRGSSAARSPSRCDLRVPSRRACSRG